MDLQNHSVKLPPSVHSARSKALAIPCAGNIATSSWSSRTHMQQGFAITFCDAEHYPHSLHQLGLRQLHFLHLLRQRHHLQLHRRHVLHLQFLRLLHNYCQPSQRHLKLRSNLSTFEIRNHCRSDSRLYASCSALVAVNRRYFDDGRCQGHVDFTEFGRHALQVSASIACIQHRHVYMTKSFVRVAMPTQTDRRSQGKQTSKAASKPVSQRAGQPARKQASQPASQAASQPASQSPSKPASHAASHSRTHTRACVSVDSKWTPDGHPDGHLDGHPGGHLIYVGQTAHQCCAIKRE